MPVFFSSFFPESRHQKLRALYGYTNKTYHLLSPEILPETADITNQRVAAEKTSSAYNDKTNGLGLGWLLTLIHKPNRALRKRHALRVKVYDDAVKAQLEFLAYHPLDENNDEEDGIELQEFPFSETEKVEKQAPPTPYQRALASKALKDLYPSWRRWLILTVVIAVGTVLCGFGVAALIGGGVFGAALAALTFASQAYAVLGSTYAAAGIIALGTAGMLLAAREWQSADSIWGLLPLGIGLWHAHRPTLDLTFKSTPEILLRLYLPGFCQLHKNTIELSEPVFYADVLVDDIIHAILNPTRIWIGTVNLSAAFLIRGIESFCNGPYSTYGESSQWHYPDTHWFPFALKCMVDWGRDTLNLLPQLLHPALDIPYQSLRLGKQILWDGILQNIIVKRIFGGDSPPSNIGSNQSTEAPPVTYSALTPKKSTGSDSSAKAADALPRTPLRAPAGSVPATGASYGSSPFG